MSHRGDAEGGGIAVGIRARDGVALASDRRAIDGSIVAGEERKVAPVHPTAAVATPVMDGPVEAYVRALRSEASSYEHGHDRPMSISALAARAGDLAAERDPGRSIVLGGVDEEGPQVARIDPDGGVLTDDWVAVGAGRELAAGALEGAGEEDLALEDAARRAVGVVETAAEREATAGGGVTVARITGDGVAIEAVEPDADE